MRLKRSDLFGEAIPLFDEVIPVGLQPILLCLSHRYCSFELRLLILQLKDATPLRLHRLVEPLGIPFLPFLFYLQLLDHTL